MAYVKIKHIGEIGRLISDIIEMKKSEDFSYNGNFKSF